MKRNFIPLSFICVMALPVAFTAWADFGYHAEIPKDSKVPTDYLEKRKALGSVAPSAESWQKQLDEEKARIDAEAAKRENEKQAKCQQQEHYPARRAENDKRQYAVSDPCASSIGINIY
ncbi:hypothetical protein V1951_09100 [Yersinia sp. 2544 StPb PI]|uniref:hypothetical protein n=1 Tax=unclassified Yersinia (in: enterobacteria) TaxID=2653513 RepID=UPI00355BD8F9